jgi:uncharacterized membrane protein YgdD (TMEM256/DUF423 family)
MTSTMIVLIVAAIFGLLAIVCGALASHHHDEENKHWDR